jgi:glutamate racemase
VEKLILGCTHYPHIQRVFEKIMGPHVEIINPAEEAVKRLQAYFDRHPEVERHLTQNGEAQFFTTDCPSVFSEQGKIFYGSAFEAQKISI